MHTSSNIPDEKIATFTNGMNIPALTDHDKETCEGPISMEECRAALQSMGCNKAPSASGFNKEFILFFWDDLKEIIVRYVNEAYSTGQLFVTQRRGVLTLIPKPGDQKQMKNKRPICLLDIVYKIIAKVLAMRLSVVIKKIVSPDQTGSIKGRNIQDNLRIIQDLIEYTNRDNIPGIMCALDFKSAFNSVEHNFLFHTLQVFGFGESFIRWIKILYNGTELSVINNGFTSAWFKPQRGVMQGCPISGLLFVLAVELLAIKIQNSANIKGITINGATTTISQYCDDATVFIQDEASMIHLVHVLKEYGEVSGLELNVNKSKLLWLGPNRQCNNSVAGIPSVQCVKILGLWFSAVKNCEQDNLDPVLKSITVTTNMWSQRDLSIKGRIVVSKSLLISKLIYILPCVNLSSDNLHAIHSRIMKYIWRGRPPKVAAAVLCQDIADGGLGAMNVELLYKSLKIIWIKRMLCDDHAWVRLLQARCQPLSLADLLKCRYVKKDLVKFKLLPFYEDVLVGYRETNALEPPSDAKQVHKELLWLNKFIKCDGGAILDRTMYASGIRNVGDITDRAGTLLNYQNFKQKYPNCRTSFLRYLGITSSIPRQWKDMIRQRGGNPIDASERNVLPYMMHGIKRIYITAITTKLLYRALKPVVTPTAVQRWEYQGLAPDNWAEVFYIPYTCTASTKLQSFQYQVLHRYIPTRKFLHLRGLVDSANCPQCDSADTMVHYFFSCRTTRNFWNKVLEFINVQMPHQRVNCDVKNVMFGVPGAPPIVNLIILCAKHYMHLRKVKGHMLVYAAFESYLKNICETEKYAARACVKKERAWNIKWRSFRNVLEN